MLRARNARRMVAMAIAVATLSASSAGADTLVYFISMRSFTSESAPNYVSVAAASGGAQTVAIAACDGNIYYATSADASAVATARAAGETVQLHQGAPGVDGPHSDVVCLLQ